MVCFRLHWSLVVHQIYQWYPILWAGSTGFTMVMSPCRGINLQLSATLTSALTHWLYWSPHQKLLHEIQVIEVLELTHASYDISSSGCFLSHVPWGGRRRAQPDMEGRQYCWLLDILRSTLQSYDKLQPNPSQICSWCHNETRYIASPSRNREHQLKSKGVQR